jgi:hypothetical protein
MAERLRDAPIPPQELLRNLALFTLPQDLKRYLFLNEIYERLLEVHGVIFEMGVRWGRDLALLQSLRAIHEPFNYGRRIVGFDTFEGFAGVAEQDGAHPIMAAGAYGVTDGYQQFLERCLRGLEQEAPVAELQKFELVGGDASVTVPEYLRARPETVVAFAYFDMDIYKPTRDCLEALLPRMPRGAVIGFDELNHPANPGETLALLETLGIRNVALKRSRYSNYESYIVL